MGSGKKVGLGVVVVALLVVIATRRNPSAAENQQAPAKETKSALRGDASRIDGLSAALARGTPDSLRTWVSGLDDAALRQHLEKCVEWLAEDSKSPEALRFRAVLAALAMEGGRRDVEGFTAYLKDKAVAEKRVGVGVRFREGVNAAIAGYAESNPADAWRRLQGEVVHDFGKGVSHEFTNCLEAAAQTFQLWTERDPDAALAAIHDFPSVGGPGTSRFVGAVGAFAASCPAEELPGLISWAKRQTPSDGSDNKAPALIRSLAANLARRDPQAAWDLVTSGNWESPEEYLRIWACDQPDEALAFARTLDSNEIALRYVASGMARDDPQRAIQVLAMHPDSEVSTGSILEFWMLSPADIANDQTWPIYKGAAPRVSATERNEVIFRAAESMGLPAAQMSRITAELR
jgi:hypothetical protein